MTQPIADERSIPALMANILEDAIVVSGITIGNMRVYPEAQISRLELISSTTRIICAVGKIQNLISETKES